MQKVVRVFFHYVPADKKTYFPAQLDPIERTYLFNNGYLYVCTREGKSIYNRPVTVKADITLDNRWSVELREVKETILKFYNRKIINQELVRKLETEIAQGKVEVHYSKGDGLILTKAKEQRKLDPIEAVEAIELTYHSSNTRFYYWKDLEEGGEKLTDELEKHGFTESYSQRNGKRYSKPAQVSAKMTLHDGVVIELVDVKDVITKFYKRQVIHKELVDRLMMEIRLGMVEAYYDSKARMLKLSHSEGLFKFMN